MDRQPPRYTIDLSLPPRERYKELALAYKQRVQDLPELFDQICSDMRLPLRPCRLLSRLCLRKVYHADETEELQGIASVTGLSLWLLVALNVLLDLFMGCTSGGVQTQEAKDGQSKMLHFRTLDWGMDPLRQVIVTLDFVQSRNGPVVASSITYVGFVGVLTGVRRDLSASLNFRPCHNSSRRSDNYRFYLNHLYVLLGLRPSISSVLRECILPSPTHERSRFSTTSLASLVQELPKLTTTAAYIILCDGDRTVVLEKDRLTAKIFQSDSFITATNHDVEEESKGRKAPPSNSRENTALQLTGMEGLVEESIDRKETIGQLWRAASRPVRKRGSKRLGKCRRSVCFSDVVDWMLADPIRNEETHFATIMDPQTGSILWIERFLE